MELIGGQIHTYIHTYIDGYIDKIPKQTRERFFIVEER